MREQHPMTQTMKISEFKIQISDIVNRVYRKEARAVVEKSGIPVAGLVSVDDLRLLDREREQRFAVVDEMREAFAGVPEEELEREADRALARILGPHVMTKVF